MICFRYNPGGLEESKLNALNQGILKKVNESGKVFMTHTKIRGKFTIRLIAGQTYVERRHVQLAWDQLQKVAENEMKHV
jgi:aromatic-L-amino-acid decarboxylase